MKIRTELDNLGASPPSFNDYNGELFTNFQPVSEEVIRELIMHSLPKTCVLDPLPTEIVKENIDILVPVITEIVNMSLASGVVPMTFKKAVVTPLIKKNNLDKNILKNYRPVSNLPFISKILEKVVLKQCQVHLSQNNLFEINQSAYRKNHSKQTALLSVVDGLIARFCRSCICLALPWSCLRGRFE